MDPYDSPLRSPIVVPITHSPIPYEEPGRFSLHQRGFGRGLPLVRPLRCTACGPGAPEERGRAGGGGSEFILWEFPKIGNPNIVPVIFGIHIHCKAFTVVGERPSTVLLQ